MEKTNNNKDKNKNVTDYECRNMIDKNENHHESRVTGNEDKAAKGSKKRQIVLDILIAVFTLIAVSAGAYIINYYYKSRKTEARFDDLRNMIVEVQDDRVGNIEAGDSSNAENGSENTKRTDLVDIDGRDVLIKYQKLYKANMDFMGWLKIDGTDIDYPVMYTPDEREYYLHKNFDREYSYAGCLFIDNLCIPTGDDISDNIIIYGHNMKSGTMFHQLTLYRDESFYRDHKYISFDTLEDTGTYEVIAAFKTQVYEKGDMEHYHYYDFHDAADEEEFNEFIQYIRSCCTYDFDSTANYGDKLITLSTCSYHVNDGRYVVVAKKISN